MSLLLLLGTTVATVVAAERFVTFLPPMGQRSRRTYSLSLRQLLSRRERILISSGEISTYIIEDFDRDQVDKHVREKFKDTVFDEFSIGWMHPSLNEATGKRVHGAWSTMGNSSGYTKVYFYRWPKPPAPPPEPEKPKPQVGWTTADEQHRQDLYRANPLAFWLGPDFGQGWDTATQERSVKATSKSGTFCLWTEPTIVQTKTTGGKFNSYMYHDVYDNHVSLNGSRFIGYVMTDEGPVGVKTRKEAELLLYKIGHSRSR